MYRQVSKLDNEKGILFLKNRIIARLGEVKDLLGPYRYKLYIAMVEECNDFNELRDMAELDLQMDMFDYVRNEIEPKMAELNLSLPDLRKLDAGVDYSTLSKPKELELTPDDIPEALDDPEVDSAMAMLLAARLANEPAEEKYRQEMLDFTFESDPAYLANEIDEVDDAELSQYGNMGADEDEFEDDDTDLLSYGGEGDDTEEESDDDDSELLAYGDEELDQSDNTYDGQVNTLAEDEIEQSEDDIDNDLLAYGSDETEEQTEPEDDDEDLLNYFSDEPSEAEPSEDEDADLLAYAEDEPAEQMSEDEIFDNSMGELEAYGDEPNEEPSEPMSEDEIFDDSMDELEAYGDEGAEDSTLMSEDEIFDESVDALGEEYDDGFIDKEPSEGNQLDTDKFDLGDLEFEDDDDLSAYGDESDDSDNAGQEPSDDDILSDLDDDDLSAYADDDIDEPSEQSDSSDDMFSDLDDDDLSAYGDEGSGGSEDTAQDDDPLSDIDDSELVGLIDDSGDYFSSSKPKPSEAIKPSESAKVHSKSAPQRAVGGVKPNTVFRNGTARGDKAQQMFNVFTKIGAGSSMLAKQVKKSTEQGIKRIVNFSDFDFDGGENIDF